MYYSTGSVRGHYDLRMGAGFDGVEHEGEDHHDQHHEHGSGNAEDCEGSNFLKRFECHHLVMEAVRSGSVLHVCWHSGIWSKISQSVSQSVSQCFGFDAQPGNAS